MSIFVQYKAGGQIVGGMFAFATVTSGWLAFIMNIPLEQAYLFELGLILGCISSLLVIFEAHTYCVERMFKEKKILETIYFRDMQDTIGGLLYFMPATLLFTLLLIVHPFPKSPEAYRWIKFIIIGVGFGVLYFEYRKYSSTKKVLSDRIKRAKLYFQILEDPETRMWSIPDRYPKSGRTPLLKTALDALASKNWSSFEIVEQNWKSEIKTTLQAIKQHTQEFNKIWEGEITFIHRRTEPVQIVRDSMKNFSERLSKCSESLWAAGFYRSNSMNRQKYEFLNKITTKVEITGRSYLQRLINDVTPKVDIEEPGSLKNYIIEATVLDFLGINVVTEGQDKIYQTHSKFIAGLRREIGISMPNSSEIKDFFNTLKMVTLKLEEIEKEDATEEEWEFEWDLLPELFR